MYTRQLEPTHRHAKNKHVRDIITHMQPLRHDTFSDGVLQGGNWERLDDSLGRLGLDNDDLAEHLTLAGLGGWLQAGLDHADTWDDELARALDLLGGDLSQSGQDLVALRLLQLSAVCQEIADLTLGDGLDNLLSLHCLHWGHGFKVACKRCLLNKMLLSKSL